MNEKSLNTLYNLEIEQRILLKELDEIRERFRKINLEVRDILHDHCIVSPMENKNEK